MSLSWCIQQLVPPGLLTYFAVCWRICAFEIGPEYIGHRLGLPLIGKLYSTFATISLTPLVILFLRLYFLPRDQSLPPFNPPLDIQHQRIIYECLSPADEALVNTSHPGRPGHDNGLVNRCYKDKCGGRWKPPRARHCSTCQTCRAGFDHHCAIFANCLTVPHIPTFLSLLVLAPPVIFILSSPLFIPLGKRAMEAWRLACTDERIRGWWDWWPSWIIAGGPVGRWMGGLILAWRVLDAGDGGEVRLRNGLLVGVGGLISGVCMGLAATTISLVRRGQLTIDRERARSHSRALHAIHILRKQGKPIPQKMEQEVDKWAEKRWFFVPSVDTSKGRVVSTLEQVYDLDNNWQAIMGEGWGWVLPWQALRRGMSLNDICVWKIRPEVTSRLKRQAESSDAEANVE